MKDPSERFVNFGQAGAPTIHRSGFRWWDGYSLFGTEVLWVAGLTLFPTVLFCFLASKSSQEGFVASVVAFASIAALTAITIAGINTCCVLSDRFEGTKYDTPANLIFVGWMHVCGAMAVAVASVLMMRVVGLHPSDTIAYCLMVGVAIAMMHFISLLPRPRNLLLGERVSQRFRCGGLMTGHQCFVGDLLFTGDSKRLISSSWDQTVRIWDTDTGQELVCLRGKLGHVKSIALSIDNRHLFTLTNGYYSSPGMVVIWDLKTESILRHVPITGECIALSPDESMLVVGGDQIRFLSTESGKAIRELPTHGAKSLRFSTSGDRLLSAEGRTMRLHDVHEGTLLQEFKGHTETINTIAFAENDRMVLSGSGDYTDSIDNSVRIWDAATGKEVRRYEKHTRAVRAMAVLPDGCTVVSGSYGKNFKDGILAPNDIVVDDVPVRKWRLDDLTDLRHYDVPKTKLIGSIAVSPDGQTIAVGGHGLTGVFA